MSYKLISEKKICENLKEKKFNKVTEKTLKMSEQRKGLKKFDSLAELFEDLGI